MITETREATLMTTFDLGTSSLRRCETRQPRTKRRSGARTCGPSRCLVLKRAPVAGGPEERAQRTPEQKHGTTTEEVTGHWTASARIRVALAGMNKAVSLLEKFVGSEAQQEAQQKGAKVYQTALGFFDQE